MIEANGLDEGLTEDDIRMCFEEYGAIKKLNIYTYPRDGLFYAHAIILFHDKQSALAADKVKNYNINGVEITAELLGINNG